QDRPHVDGLALGHSDLGHEPGLRGRHLAVDLVRRHLEQRLVELHPLADLLEPLRDRALGDGLTELGHCDLCHVEPFGYQWRERPVSESTVSPNSSLIEGCGWMKAATSSTVASQFT